MGRPSLRQGRKPGRCRDGSSRANRGSPRRNGTAAAFFYVYRVMITDRDGPEEDPLEKGVATGNGCLLYTSDAADE